MVDQEKREETKKPSVAEIVLGLRSPSLIHFVYPVSILCQWNVYQRVILILIGVVVFLLWNCWAMIIEHQNGYF